MSVPVTSVPRSVLRDDVDLLHAQRPETGCFADQVVDRLRAVEATHEWNRAERARVIAPLADLQIRGAPGPGGKHPERALHRRNELVGLGEVAPTPQLRHERWQLGQAQEEVDLGDLSGELPLRDAGPDTRRRPRPRGGLPPSCRTLPGSSRSIALWPLG